MDRLMVIGGDRRPRGLTQLLNALWTPRSARTKIPTPSLPPLPQSPPSRQQLRHMAFVKAFKKVTQQFPDRPRQWRRKVARGMRQPGRTS